MPLPGFFNQEQEKSALVNVGGTGDCGFRSIAAGIVDNALTTKSRANQELLGRLLKRYFSYFPAAKAEGLLTPIERLEEVIKSSGMIAFIRKFAYSLRQIAVDELCAHPEKYRGAFTKENEGTSPASMREENTWIDESAIAALSNSLELPIEVKVVEQGKELPMRLHYNESDKKLTVSPVVMQLQNGHYMPQLEQPARFKAVSEVQISPRALEPVVSKASVDPILPEIYAKIEKEDKRLLEEFHKTSRRLSSMVTAKEISKDDLLGIYIKGMDNSEYLRGRVKYVGIEYGNQDFFKALEKKRGGKPVKFPQESYHDQVTKELVHAIARAVSIGQLDVATVFAKIEKDAGLQTFMM